MMKQLASLIERRIPSPARRSRARSSAPSAPRVEDAALEFGAARRLLERRCVHAP